MTKACQRCRLLTLLGPPVSSRLWGFSVGSLWLHALPTSSPALWWDLPSWVLALPLLPHLPSCDKGQRPCPATGGARALCDGLGQAGGRSLCFPRKPGWTWLPSCLLHRSGVGMGVGGRGRPLPLQGGSSPQTIQQWRRSVDWGHRQPAGKQLPRPRAPSAGPGPHPSLGGFLLATPQHPDACQSVQSVSDSNGLPLQTQHCCSHLI